MNKSLQDLDLMINMVIPRTKLWAVSECGCHECCRRALPKEYGDISTIVLDELWPHFTPIRNATNQTKERMKQK